MRRSLKAGRGGSDAVSACDPDSGRRRGVYLVGRLGWRTRRARRRNHLAAGTTPSRSAHGDRVVGHDPGTAVRSCPSTSPRTRSAPRSISARSPAASPSRRTSCGWGSSRDPRSNGWTRSPTKRWASRSRLAGPLSGWQGEGPISGSLRSTRASYGPWISRPGNPDDRSTWAAVSRRPSRPDSAASG